MNWEYILEYMRDHLLALDILGSSDAAVSDSGEGAKVLTLVVDTNGFNDLSRLTILCMVWHQLL